MILFKYWDRKILLFFCLFQSNFAISEHSIANRVSITPNQLEPSENKNFKILGILQLESQINSEYRLAETSGLAWDHDQQSLILLSDRGYFIHTKPIFKKGTLIDLDFLSYHQLLDSNNKKLKNKSTDSEGLALLNSKNNLKNDTELLISFERKPRIIKYTTDGKYISKQALNNDLNNIKNYKSENKALEAITLHDQFNIITGPERPLDNNSNSLSLHNLQNKKWLFKPDNEKHGSLVGLTTLPNNRIIALERIFSNIFTGVSHAIHLITLNEDSIEQKVLFRTRPEEAYLNENFEGISWHEENRFFMISDDNDNPFQRTLLMYFEIPDLNFEKLNRN